MNTKIKLSLLGTAVAIALAIVGFSIYAWYFTISNWNTTPCTDECITYDPSITENHAREIAQMQAKIDGHLTTISQLNTQISNLGNQLELLGEDKEELRVQLQGTINTLTSLVATLEQTIENYRIIFGALERDENRRVVTFKVDGAIFDIQIVQRGEFAITPTFQNTQYIVLNYWTLNGAQVNPSEIEVQSDKTFIANVTHLTPIAWTPTGIFNVYLDGEVFVDQVEIVEYNYGYKVVFVGSPCCPIELWFYMLHLALYFEQSSDGNFYFYGHHSGGSVDLISPLEFNPNTGNFYGGKFNILGFILSLTMVRDTGGGA